MGMASLGGFELPAAGIRQVCFSGHFDRYPRLLRLDCIDLLWPRRDRLRRRDCRGGYTHRRQRGLRLRAEGRQAFRQGVLQREAVLFGLIPLARPRALAEVLAVDLSADPFRAVAAAERPVGSVLAVTGVAGKTESSTGPPTSTQTVLGSLKWVKTRGGNVQITYKKPPRFWLSTLTYS